MPVQSTPLLSIVVVSRNDDHGGSAIGRMQLFVTGLLEQTRRHNLNSELVIVEWNPPCDRPRLADALRWPDTPGPCSVRVIEVSPEIHRRFKHSDRLPLFQMIGKNVGVRRARGRFILATNMDILFSDELLDFIASARLSSGRMYRVDRYDVPSEIPDAVSIEEQLAYCCRNVIRINSRDGTQVLEHGNSNGRHSLRKWVKHWIRKEASILHTNACGDFTLMAREHWLAVRGYAEFEMFSFKLDGLLCYAAHYAGAKETILKDPNRIYHIEHAAGSGWTPGAGVQLLKNRLTACGIPQLSREQYLEWVTRMRREQRPINL